MNPAISPKAGKSAFEKLFEIYEAIDTSITSLDEWLESQITGIDIEQLSNQAKVQTIHQEIQSLRACMHSANEQIAYLDQEVPEELSNVEGQSSFTHVHKWHKRSPNLVCSLKAPFPIRNYTFLQTQGVEWHDVELLFEKRHFQATIKPIRQDFTAHVTLYGWRREIWSQELDQARQHTASLYTQIQQKEQGIVVLNALMTGIDTRRRELSSRRNLCGDDRIIIGSLLETVNCSRLDIEIRQLVEVGSISGIAARYKLQSSSGELQRDWEKCASGQAATGLMNAAIRDRKDALRVLKHYQQERERYIRDANVFISELDSSLKGYLHIESSLGPTQNKSESPVHASQEICDFGKFIMKDVKKFEDHLQVELAALQGDFPSNATLHQISSDTRQLEKDYNSCLREQTALVRTKALFRSDVKPIGVIGALQKHVNKITAFEVEYSGQKITSRP